MTGPSNVTTEANRDIVRQAFDDWGDGTRAISDVFAADMVWRIEGHSLASKTYADKQQFIDEVLAPFGARFSASDPFRSTTASRSTTCGPASNRVARARVQE